MNNNPNLFSIDLARLKPLLTFLGICLLLSTLGLGWIIKSVSILIGLVIFVPVIGFAGFFWWVRQNIVQADCPVCNYSLQGVNGSEIQCSNCGELLKVMQGKLCRDTPADTIDVIAVEVEPEG